MNKIFTIAGANIKKSKSQTITLLLLVLVATMLLNIGLVLYFDFGNFFYQRAQELNAPHISIIQSEKQSSEEQIEFLKNYDGVTQTETQSVLAGNGDYYINGSKTIATMLFAKVDSDQKMNPVKLIGESLELDDESIYVPYLMKSIGDYKIGEQYKINLNNIEYSYKIAGFTEEITYGAALNTIYRFYLSDASYDKLAVDNPLWKSSIQSARMDDKSKALRLGLDYSKEYFYGSNNLEGEKNNAITDAFSTLTLDNAKMARSFIATIMAMVIVAFSIILLGICLVVIRFRIVNSIEDGMVNIGILKALGYQSKQIISAIVFQFTFISLIGLILGFVSTQLIMPILTGVLESQFALLWSYKVNMSWVIFTTLLIIGSIFLTSFLVSMRIRKLPVLSALQNGSKTHSFKKNYFPLEKSKGSVVWLLALKQLLQNKKQAFMIAVIISLVTFAAVASVSIYYNIGVEPEEFTKVIAGEKPDAILVLKNNAETEKVINTLENNSKIRKSFCYDNVNLMVDGYQLMTFTAKDFMDLEGNLLYEGRYPKHTNEVAIGGNMSKISGKKIGDKVTILNNGIEKEFYVTGIIQMINNQGMTMITPYDGLLTVKSEYKFSQIYVYAQKDENVKALIDEIKKEHGDVFASTIDMKDMVEGQFSSFNQIFAALTIIILTVTAMVVFLVLYLVIKTAILQRQKNLGIQKAIGFTTFELMNQIALNFTPIVLVGIIIGGAMGYVGFNPMFAMLTKSVGIIQTNLPTPMLWTIVTSLSIVIFSYLMALIISWRLRKLSPYNLVRE